MSGPYTNLDVQQIQQVIFDPETGATKVKIVGLDSVELKADLKPVIEAIEKLGQSGKGKEAIEPTERLVILKEPQIVQVEVERIVLQDRIVEVEKQVVVTQEIIKTIPVPVVETKFERVEIPVITTQIKEVLPLWTTIVVAVQSAVIISMIIARFIN